MKKQLVKLILVMSMILLLGGQSAYAIPDWSFDLLPAGGNVSGPAGSTVGWGYEIQNLSDTYWLSVMSLDSDIFLSTNGIPDATIFDYPSLAPLATWSVAYLPDTAGLYQFTWDSGVTDGTTEAGEFRLTAEWYNVDPLGGGSLNGAAPDKNAAYTATVTSAAVPEPATWLLLVSGLAGIVAVNTIMLRRRQYTAAEVQT
jgi:hypothetical protein